MGYPMEVVVPVWNRSSVGSRFRFARAAGRSRRADVAAVIGVGAGPQAVAAVEDELPARVVVQDAAAARHRDAGLGVRGRGEVRAPDQCEPAGDGHLGALRGGRYRLPGRRKAPAWAQGNPRLLLGHRRGGGRDPVGLHRQRRRMRDGDRDPGIRHQPAVAAGGIAALHGHPGSQDCPVCCSSITAAFLPPRGVRANRCSKESSIMVTRTGILLSWPALIVGVAVVGALAYVASQARGETPGKLTAEDRLEIQELLHRYMYVLDSCPDHGRRLRVRGPLHRGWPVRVAGRPVRDEGDRARQSGGAGRPDARRQLCPDSPARRDEPGAHERGADHRTVTRRRAGHFVSDDDRRSRARGGTGTAGTTTSTRRPPRDGGSSRGCTWAAGPSACRSNWPPLAACGSASPPRQGSRSLIGKSEQKPEPLAADPLKWLMSGSAPAR